MIEYCVEPKFDGAVFHLSMKMICLVRGATRGDGVEGDDITTNIKQIRSLFRFPRNFQLWIAAGRNKGRSTDQQKQF